MHHDEVHTGAQAGAPAARVPRRSRSKRRAPRPPPAGSTRTSRWKPKWERKPKAELFCPIREWVDLNGETRFALHPLTLALSRHYGDDSFEESGRRVGQIVTGERRLPDGVAEEMIEIDRVQRGAGGPDEDIAGLVELLRSCWKGSDE